MLPPRRSSVLERGLGNCEEADETYRGAPGVRTLQELGFGYAQFALDASSAW